MDWMIDKNDPARLEIIERAKALKITGTPERAAHALGPITLADGRTVQAHVVHAVDPIITDGKFVVMIDRKNDPGKGKPALPGGFMDPLQGGGTESAVQAAVREAMEEVGITLGEGKLVGTRNMDRPFDVRVAKSDLPQYDIKAGDIFMVSTQAVRFDVPDLANTKLTAGDDAKPGSARRVAIDSLTRDGVGIPDHFDMIQTAMPELFTSKAIAKDLLLVGNHLAPAIANDLKADGKLGEIPASIGFFGNENDEPFAELYHGQKETYASNVDKIKGARVFIGQSSGAPVSSSLMHLFLAADTAKRAGAREVVAVIPFKALDRQDRPFDKRFTSEGAALLAKLLKAAGVDGVITLTPHSQDSMKPFEAEFGDKFYARSATKLFAADIKTRFGNISNVMIGAPDGSDKPLDEGQERAKELIKATFGAAGQEALKHRFGIKKKHISVHDTEPTYDYGDVAGKDCIIVDDMTDGGSTLYKGAKLLKSLGAKSVTAYVTHGILANGFEKILLQKTDDNRDAIDTLVVTNTLPDVEAKLATLHAKSPELAERVEILNAGPLLREGIEQYAGPTKDHPRIARREILGTSTVR